MPQGNLGDVLSQEQQGATVGSHERQLFPHQQLRPLCLPHRDEFDLGQQYDLWRMPALLLFLGRKRANRLAYARHGRSVPFDAANALGCNGEQHLDYEPHFL